TSGPEIAPQNSGVDEHWAGDGTFSTLPTGPLLGVPGGSLPNVLHGLPIGAGPLKSAMAARDIDVESIPRSWPNWFLTGAEIVTLSWVGFSPCSTRTTVPSPLRKPLSSAISRARARALPMSSGMKVTPAVAAA